ncbi:hypothetical protein J1N35_005419 [Gossypium stocksii]|uniref:Uncharacterized protein n=1 Tax=Gossypium stocksii TaxID=47602 RepID=A0A9D3WDS2_9ROSI|nr:hypothetical protein J1N35_005419 [Gossypium stocksii]
MNLHFLFPRLYKSATRRGIHWCSWEGLCDLKEAGGLGFHSLSKLNIALLAKQGWRLLTNPNSLMARVLKPKYFLHNNFMELGLGINLYLCGEAFRPPRVCCRWAVVGRSVMGNRFRTG